MATTQFDLNIPFEHDTNELPDLNVDIDHNIDQYSISDLNLDPLIVETPLVKLCIPSSRV